MVIEQSEIPRLIEKVLLRLSFSARLHPRTHVPVIKFCESPSPTMLEGFKRLHTAFGRVRKIVEEKALARSKKAEARKEHMRLEDRFRAEVTAATTAGW